MFSEKFRLELERKILLIMETQLRSGQMSADRAKGIARYVMSMLPPTMPLDAIPASIISIGQKYMEFAQLALSSKTDVEEVAKAQALPAIHTLLQQGNVNAAYHLVTKITRTVHGDLSGGDKQ